MMSLSKIGSFVVVSLVASGAVRAGSLEEQRWKDDYEKALQLSVKPMNEHCGTAITAKVDWSQMKYDDFVHKISIAGLAPNTVESVCHTGDDAKAAVKKSIKTIVVKPGPGNESKFTLKDGELVLYLAPSHNIARDAATAWLLKSL